MSINSLGVVLAVDDDALVLELMGAAVEEAGFVVKAAPNLSAALDVLRTHPTDRIVALVTDVRLGAQSGWELARCARAIDPALPVLYVTGDSGHEWSSQGVPRSHILVKPFSLEALGAAVSALVRDG